MNFGLLKKTFLLIYFCLAIPVVAQNPNDFYKQSLEQTTRGNYSDALISISKALVIDSSKVDYHMQKAIVCYHLKKFDEAIKCCYSAQKVEPNKAEILLLRGLIGLTTRSYGGAIFFFGKAIKQAKTKDCLSKAYLNRGRVYLATEKLSEALADLTSANNVCPDSIEILVTLSEIYTKTNQADEALLRLTQIITLEPKYAPAHKMMGNIYYHQTEYEKALLAFSKFCELDPNDGKVYQLISNIHCQHKDYDKAQIAITQASRLDPGEPLNYKILADIFIQKGQKEDGCNSIFKAFQLGYLEKYGYDLLDLYLTNCEGK